jgi:glycosyltransferase involved in cell wall biosynthesis
MSAKSPVGEWRAEEPPQLRISVVVPAINEERYLPSCLSALAGQDFPSDRFEVVVVDNNSTDGTAGVAIARGVKVVHEGRPGVCFARDTGTTRSRGQLVVSTDADTTFDPGWLSRIDRMFLDRPELVAVVGPCRFVDGPWWSRVYTGLLFGAVGLVHRWTGRVLYASATYIAFRREAWSGYDTHLTQGGDELGLLRQLRTRGPIAFDGTNPTFTSSRRLTRGLAYNLFVTCLYYYLCGYLLNRVTGRRVLGTAPEFREGSPATSRVRGARLALEGVAAALVMGLLVARLGVDLA